MKNDTKRTTAIGLARYARDFFDTALAADNDIGTKPGYEIIAPIPIMYLVGHAIELGLKSYLLHNGVPLKKLPRKPFGHNLENCFNKAIELGLNDLVEFEKGEIEGLKVLNALYSSKQLNYIVTGAKQFPVFGPIQTYCQNLLDAVCPHVGYK